MNVMGLYSGIDISMVDQMIEAEKAKGVRFTQRKEQYTQSQNAWKDLNTRLDTLYKRLDELTKPENFQSKSVNLSGPENLSVNASSTAATGSYRVQVQQLATQERLTGTRVEAESIHSELNFNGSLDFAFGPEENSSFSVTVEATDSLKSINDKINEQTSKTGISSSIVDNRLILTHTEYGVQTEKLAISGDVAESLGLSNFDLTEGQKAEFTVDGLKITRSSNTIDDVIEGLTFTLTNEHSNNESTVVSITEDLDKAAETLNKFVEQYNSTQSFITQQLSVGDPSAENNKTGTLSGDGTLMRLQSNLRSMMTKSDDTESSIRSLSDLGIEVDRNGTATFDRTVLEENIKEDPEAVSAFFSRTETSEGVGEDGEPKKDSKRVGFSQSMRSFVNEYISGTTGIIKTRQDTYDRMIKDLNDRISQFETRIDAKRDRYIRQFTALDQAMMQAESQMGFMMSQLGMNQGNN
ncbi:hypothetical protein GCM10008932_13530 [Alkalibacterium iburiense]|uniref:Flagellar hook-associated protein 2 n=1 Tax=Alkalibacterium iburiense TaxID=290589 RepID=A0ABN0XEN1_9LACT